MVLLWLVIRYKHKKMSISQRNEASFEAKLKEQLQRTSETARNKASRTVGLGCSDLYREIV